MPALEVTATRGPSLLDWISDPVPADAEGTMVRSTTVVRDADTGAPVLVAMRYPGDLGVLRRALLAYPMDTTVRSRAGIRNVSMVFGYVAQARHLQRSSCRACKAAWQAPAEHAVICAASVHMAEELGRIVPEVLAHDVELVCNAVLPDWRLAPEVPWTSGVVNRSSPLPYHRDANNFDAWSVMLVVRRAMRGGYLHVPEYGLLVECRDGDLVAFKGSDLVHGVTPMQPLAKDAYRLSAVYYPVRRMRFCLSPEEELLMGRTRAGDPIPPEKLPPGRRVQT